MPIGKTYRGVLDQSDSPELVLEIPSFAGGENTVGQDQELKVNEARVIENWDSDSLGGMIRSKGFTLIASNTGGIDTYTKLMLHFDGTNGGTTFTDSETTPKTVTPAGNTNTSTAQFKFGTASGYFDGNGDWLTIPNHADFDISSGDWTIDFWMRPDDLNGRQIFGKSKQTASFDGWYLTSDGAGLLQFYSGTNTLRITASSAFSATTQAHVALVQSGTTITMYLNGTSVGTWVGNPTEFNSPLAIGTNITTGTGRYAGYIDEFRFSKGIARWTTTFTPPTSAYTAYSIAPDAALHHFEGASTRNYIVEAGDLLRVNGTDLTLTDSGAFTSGVFTHSLSAASKAWFTNATDNLKYTTISGSITVPTGVPPVAKSRIYYHKSRLIAEGGAVTVYGSRAGTGTWHASANTWTASGDAWSIDLPDLTQGCAPGFPNGSQITVFTKFGAYALTNFPNVAQNFILGSHGCSQPESIQIGAEGVYFFSLNPTLGVYLWDGGSWINLTVNETWVTEVSLTNRCFGIYSENKYRFFYNDNTSGVSYPNVCRIYDARWGRWMKRAINSSVADTFGIPMLLAKANNELYVTSSQVNKVYQLEDTSTSDNTYATQANYKTKDFTSKDFGMERDEVRMKLLKCTATYFGTTGNFTLQWSSDRGVHSGSITFDLQTTGALLNTTFIVNTSSILSGVSIPDKTVTRSFNNSAIGSRFNFQIINNGTGERVKIKKIKIVAIALEER